MVGGSRGRATAVKALLKIEDEAPTSHFLRNGDTTAQGDTRDTVVSRFGAGPAREGFAA